MGLLRTFFSQCARPEGFLGRMMLRFMNFGHAPLTNWGLGLLEIGDGWTMLDIGCGGGATLQRLLKRSREARVYGIDISEESVAKARIKKGLSPALSKGRGSTKVARSAACKARELSAQGIALGYLYSK